MPVVATTPEEGLGVVLLNETNITNLVDDRVHFSEAPQSTKRQTHIVFERSSSDFNPTLETTGGLEFLDFDIECKSLSPLGSIQLAKAVKKLLQDYTGTWGGGYRCDAVLLLDEFGDTEKPTDGSDESVSVQTVTFQFQLTEL